MQTRHLPNDYDCLAPDGSEIRLLVEGPLGSSVHCKLPAGGLSLAVAHHHVEEIWYFIEGHGEVWRQNDETEEAVKVQPGVSLTIPAGTHFQFRNTGKGPLCFLITTMPPWPGEKEARRVEDHWPVQPKQNNSRNR
jgi:mannose-6-phosphate isomerase-like protein (cupin superfamily)